MAINKPLSAKELAMKDAELYGAGFILNGKHLPNEEVEVFFPKDAAQVQQAAKKTSRQFAEEYVARSGWDATIVDAGFIYGGRFYPIESCACGDETCAGWKKGYDVEVQQAAMPVGDGLREATKNLIDALVGVRRGISLSHADFERIEKAFKKAEDALAAHPAAQGKGRTPEVDNGDYLSIPGTLRGFSFNGNKATLLTGGGESSGEWHAIDARNFVQGIKDYAASKASAQAERVAVLEGALQEISDLGTDETGHSTMLIRPAMIARAALQRGQGE